MYGFSAVASEAYAACDKVNELPDSCIPTVVCRFFNAFGPRETNPHLIPEIAAQILAWQRTLLLGNQAPKRDFIHTSDRTRAVIALPQGVVKNPSGEARRKEKPEFARSK